MKEIQELGLKSPFSQVQEPSYLFPLWMLLTFQDTLLPVLAFWELDQTLDGPQASLGLSSMFVDLLSEPVVSGSRGPRGGNCPRLREGPDAGLYLASRWPGLSMIHFR